MFTFAFWVVAETSWGAGAVVLRKKSGPFLAAPLVLFLKTKRRGSAGDDLSVF